MTNAEPGSEANGTRSEGKVPGQRAPDDASSGPAPGETLIYDGPAGRITRIGTGENALLRRELRGANAPARARYAAAVMEQLRGVIGVPELFGSVEGATYYVRAFPGILLRQLLSSPEWHLDLPALVDLAVDLTAVLARVHDRGVLHNDLRPDAILLSPTQNRPTIVNFDRATLNPGEQPDYSHINTLAGRLPYLAPEQTGRTAHPVDQRADLYALGAVLYELCTGQAPFGPGESLGLVPAPISAVSPSFPRPLSDIVDRLLESDPGRRYQSAVGVLHDLRRLRQEIVKSGGGHRGRQLAQIGPFVLGDHDFPHQLAGPARLIARDTETARLRSEFAAVCSGGSRGVLVTGRAGVGKTALINQLRPTVAAVGGWFIAGTFDAAASDLGTDALAGALGALGRLLMAEPESALLEHRRRLRSVLGSNSALVAGLAPDLAPVLGVAGDPPLGDPLDIQSRARQGALDVLRATASRERPVVLVLDSLQFAATLPLSLLDAVLAGSDIDGLLLVGAFRDDEVGEGHAIAGLVPRWTQLGLWPPAIRLDNLGRDGLAEMLEEMLRLDRREAARLADAVGARTRGNPDETIELLTALRAERALRLGENGWTWDTGEVRARLDGGGYRLPALPDPTLAVLEVLAGLGPSSEVSVLATAAGMSVEELHERLEPALAEGLVAMAIGRAEGHAAVRFRRERGRLLVRGRLGTEASHLLHLTIAHRLADDPRHLPTAAAQYLAAMPELVDPAERRRAAALLERAGRSVRVTNPAAAERFYAGGVYLLGGRIEEAADAELLLRLHLERHATVYGLGLLDTMDELFDWLLQHCADPLRLNQAVCLQISALTNRDRMAEAFRLGRFQLDRLGTPVPPPDELSAVVGAGLPGFVAWAEAGDEAGDRHRPEPTDPVTLARASVLQRLTHAAYFGDHDLLGWVILESWRIWSERGPQRHLVETLSHSALMTIGRVGDFRAGYRVGRRVLAISAERGYEPETSYARYLYGAIASPWFEPLEAAIADLQRAESGLLRGGEPQAAFSYLAQCVAMLDFAPRLDDLLATVDRGLALAARMGNDQARQLILSYRSLALVLRDAPRPAGSPSPDLGPDTELTVPVATLHHHLAAGLLAAVSGDDAALQAHLEAVMPMFGFLESSYTGAQAQMLYALSLTRSLQTDQDQEDVRERLLASRAWLGRRAADAPAQFGHLISWIDAETAWADGDPLAAMKHFDDAVLHTTPHRGWHRALLMERYARFRKLQDHDFGVRSILIQARDAYAAWGATRKVGQLHEQHAFLRSVEPEIPSPNRAGSPGRADSFAVGQVDLRAVLAASQAISRETGFDALHARAVEVLTGLSGATDVTILIREDDGSWSVPGRPVNAEAHFLVSAFRLAERTGEPLLVADATQDDRFGGDAYLRDLSCCALMVVPVPVPEPPNQQGSPGLVLVLENHLHSNAFDAGRLDAVGLVGDQLAVAFGAARAQRHAEYETRQRERLLETAQQRERLLETLLAIQRDIVQRVPLPMILEAVTEGASGLLGGAFVALVLLDPQGEGPPAIPSVSGHRAGAETDERVRWSAAAAIEADELVSVPDAGGVTLIAAPIHAAGRAIGSLVSSAADRVGPEDWRQDLLGAFAEQVSLALNDAGTLEAIREASYDTLTGLPNRALFLDRLKHALAGPEGHEVSVLFIEVDRFKAVNDTLGNGAGDELLTEVAHRFGECIRGSDLVARLGGDEFAVLMEGTMGPAPGLRAAERIGTALSRPIPLGGRDIFASISVGLANATTGQFESGELLRQAGLAMYRAKKTGARRAVVFEPKMQQDAQDHLELEGDLRRALSESQFELVYQPLMDLQAPGGGRPLGVETLIRWRHPERGMISPVLFVPIAEETGAVVEMGRWVLVQSCRQVVAWRRHTQPDLRLNINVSARQLSDGQLAKDVISTLAETGLPASALTLELTETVLMEDPEGITAQLSELRRIGVQVGIDDFGTGYSSLSYLRRFPVDKLKIDKSFIDNIETVSEDMAIVRTVVDLARTLSLETTAEGIESQGQADLLRAAGCEVGQGYLFARPLPPEEIPGFLSTY